MSTLNRVRAALQSRTDAAALTDDEAALFDDLLGHAMDTIQTPSEKAFWATFKNQPNTDLDPEIAGH